MTEAVDVYADQFTISTGPYGAMLSFNVSSHIPAAPGQVQQPERVATIRMSLEHLKVMAFILHRQLMQHEQQTGTTIPLPQQILNQLQIGREDWDAFWRT